MKNEDRYALQQRCLKELAAYAKANSPYYSMLYQCIDESTPLSSLPVTNKSDLMAHFDDWVILEAVDENNQPVPFGTQSAKVLLTNLANKICPIIRFEITDRIVLHNELCRCGNTRPWLTLEGRTDDILTFANGIRIAPLSLYAIIKEVHGIERFQLIQTCNDRLELRLLAADKQKAFAEAKQAVESYLGQNDKQIAISAKHLKKTFGKGENIQVIYSGPNIDIYKEDFTVIIGSSGEGKSRS